MKHARWGGALLSQDSSNTAVRAAAEQIGRQWRRSPRVAIVLGTGLGSLARSIDRQLEIALRDLPGFPVPTALAHQGTVICGCFQGVPVVMFGGRCHLYEGYRADQATMPIRLAAQLGITKMILSNASGGLNPVYRSGDVMLIADHIDLMGPWSRGMSLPGGSADHVPSLTPAVYDPHLLDLATAEAARAGLFVHRGIYAAVKGPNYETRAEYRMLRRLGADVVGMSTVPEALCAANLGMQVLGLSVVTNVARPDLAARVDAQHVVDMAARTEPRLHEMIARLVPEIGGVQDRS